MAKAKVQKTVQIIARYAHKCNGIETGLVSFKVRSSNGKNTYCTTLLNGVAVGCSCQARVKCYHMTQLEAIESERRAVAAHEAFIEASNIEAVPAQTPAPVVEVPETRITAEQVWATIQDHELGLIVNAPEKCFAPGALREGMAQARTKSYNTVGYVAWKDLRALPKAPSITDRMMNASLNGSRAFSLMR